jgi:hypothetical protein|tara:strand:- start:260 stop:496 length:237 start_codon:yes stop_codon:yes gene_type:complete
MKKPTIYKIEAYVAPAPHLFENDPEVIAGKIVADVHESLMFIDTIQTVAEMPTIEEMAVVPKAELDSIRSIHAEAINA